MVETLSQNIVKYVDYGTEEWVKQLMERDSSRKLQTLVPYIGVLVYPSADFKTGTVYNPSVQFQDSTYIGYMDMLLPPCTPSDNSKTSFTVLEFELDGVKRYFTQVSKPNAVDANGKKFGDIIALKYPKAGHQIPFNRSFVHSLSGIKVSGGEYIDAQGWTPLYQGNGQYTSSMEFEIAISGYRLVLQ